jgi:DNA-binding response OmpR family regulator
MMENLAGKRVLVVEDDYFLADDVTRWLGEAGVVVAGPFGSCREVHQAMAHGRLDAAVLDIGLQGQSVYGLARDLAARGVPFVFYTGYPREVVPSAFAHVSLIKKPIDGKGLVSAVRDLLA